MGFMEMITAALKFLGFAAEDVGKAQDAAHDNAERQAGADSATVKGQADVIANAEQAKRIEVAMQTTAANPGSAAAEWAAGVHDKYRRPD